MMVLQLNSIGVEYCSVSDVGVLALAQHCKLLRVIGTYVLTLVVLSRESPIHTYTYL